MARYPMAENKHLTSLNAFGFSSLVHIRSKGYSRKKYLGGGGGGGWGGGGGEEGKRFIFLWVVGADIFQIIWVIDV